MKTKLTATAALMLTMASIPALADPNWAAVAGALGKAGTELPGHVYRVALSRSDLKVTLDGVAIKPGLALGSWVAFLPMGDDTMVMGDLVLTPEEVNPVMKRLEESGIEITALHNHLLRAEPATMYMHVEGHGDPVKLAAALHAALALSKTPFGTPAAAATPPKIELDTTAIDKILGHTGKANGGIYQFTIPRAERLQASGMVLPLAMGTGIAINFQPTGGGKAAITGGFVLIASEVNPVLRALREGGIDVTAVHNHMLNDEPRLFFMHFWANADAATLARALRSGLDKMNLARN